VCGCCRLKAGVGELVAVSARAVAVNRKAETAANKWYLQTFTINKLAAGMHEVA
jgi:hypothetical protein